MFVFFYNVGIFYTIECVIDKSSEMSRPLSIRVPEFTKSIEDLIGSVIAANVFCYSESRPAT